MNDIDARQLVQRYGVSWYADVDRIPIDRVGVARPNASTLVQSMEANVDEAKDNRDGIRARYEHAQRDGLFDIDTLDTIRDKKLRAAWLAAIEVQQGDKVRCIGELKHWREYLGWALGQQGVKPAPVAYDDSRLPPERDDTEINA